MAWDRGARFLLASLIWLAVPPVSSAAAPPDQAPGARPASAALSAASSNAPSDMLDELGRPIVTAVRLDRPLHLDGALDELIYQTSSPTSGFIQQVPHEGAPATEKTEVWVLFDAHSIYVAARCWDSAPPDEWVANDLRRDTTQIKTNDTFGVAFDTFYDRRNGYVLYTNPIGGRADYAVADEGANFDWNPVWDVRTGRFEHGWTVEMKVPFKSLRYNAGTGQMWGIQLRRVIRRKRR